MVCESYYEAIRQPSLAQVEAIDVGRRALHDEGSRAAAGAARRQGRDRPRHRAASVHPDLRAASAGMSRDARVTRRRAAGALASRVAATARVCCARSGIVPDRIDPAEIDETPRRASCRRRMRCGWPRQRREAVQPRHPGAFVLAADTVVACGRRILPKPADEATARACLTLLSGRRHRVYGGIALVAPDGRITMRRVDSQVAFKRLCDGEIARYLATGEWRGKAGGYAIQGRAAALISWISGSYSNVVGLPLFETAQLLAGRGYRHRCSRDLLIAAGPGEWRAAWLEDGVAVELLRRARRPRRDRQHPSRPGAAAGSGARRGLVDIGGERPAFLPEREIVPRGRRLDEGERVLVQIRREAQSGKAARLTMAVRLRGMAVAIAAGRSQPAVGEALTPDAAGLLQRWYDIEDRAARLDPPARLDPQAGFAAALAGALTAPPSRILVDDPAAIPEIRAASLPIARWSRLRETEWPIDLDAVFDQALSTTVALDGGGMVHVEATRAAVLIDVDSGTPDAGAPDRTALAVNLAAAALIARQIRLRNLGGGIVVDFVGLDRPGLRDRVRAALAEAIADDPARPQILGWTRLGHLELVRPRNGRPLAEILLEPGGDAAVKTALTVAYEALRRLRRAARAEPRRNFRLTVAPEVAAALGRGAADARAALERRLGRTITLIAEPGRPRDGLTSTHRDYIGGVMPPDLPMPAARRCPICGKPAVPQNRPFCSPRCAQIDLGRWLKGNYRLPTEEMPDDDDGVER